MSLASPRAAQASAEKEEAPAWPMLTPEGVLSDLKLILQADGGNGKVYAEEMWKEKSRSASKKVESEFGDLEKVQTIVELMRKVKLQEEELQMLLSLAEEELQETKKTVEDAEIVMCVDPQEEHTEWPIEKRSLDVPPLPRVASLLQSHLSLIYEEAEVSVVQGEEVPDLRAPPFGLTCKGLGGRNVLMDVGGVDYLFPRANLEKSYDLSLLSRHGGLPSSYLLGCGSCSYSLVGRNSELICNSAVDESLFLSKCAHMDKAHKKCEVSDYASNKVSILANVLCSEGKEGPLLRLKLKGRRLGLEKADNSSFFASKDVMRNVQEALKGIEGPVSVGGVIVLTQGKARVHVMSDFTTEQIQSQEFIDQDWLKYFSASPPFSMLTVCSANDPGLDLRAIHTHGYGEHSGEGGAPLGGHYHYDEDDEECGYEGYLALVQEVWRVDRCPQTPDFFKKVDFESNVSSQEGAPQPLGKS